MAVAGRGDSRRPLLTSREEFELRDELWRSNDKARKDEIKKLLEEVEQVRLTTNAGQQNDL